MSPSAFFDVLDRVLPPQLEYHTVDPADLHVSGRTEARAGFTPAPRQLIVHDRASAKTVVTVPVAESGLNADDYLLRIRGRMVGADEANSNGQFWSSEDLAYGLPSVAAGPLNYLHDEKRIIGALADARLIPASVKQAAGQKDGKDDVYDGLTHIETDAVVWKFLAPAEAYNVERAAADSKLFYSMECISKTVQCFGPSGCGQEMDYADAVMESERACAHIRDRTAIRRFVNPVFQGCAVIVPPVKPGWKDAAAGILKQTAMLAPIAEYTGDEALAAQILAFIASGRPTGS